MSMSDATTPKEQQTAYQRWEMSSFSEDANGKQFNHQKSKAPRSSSSSLNGALEEVRKEAYTKGMQEGFAVGMTKAQEDAEQERLLIQSIAINFNNALEVVDQKVEQDILSLALDIAKAMLKQKLTVDAEAVLPIVRDAMRHVSDINKPVSIFVHPEDARVLRVCLQEEMAEQSWHIHEDPTIQRGGCKVETEDNQVDATNETRWKRLVEALAQRNDWLTHDE